MKTLVVCSLAMLMATPALAEPKLKETPAGYSVDPELTKKFEENRRLRVLPRYSSPEWSFDQEAEESTAEGELIAADDGMLLMAFDVAPEAREVLVARGVLEVSSKEAIGDDVLFEGRWYRIFKAQPNADGLDSVERIVGRRVRVTLRPSQAGRLLVTAVRGV